MAFSHALGYSIPLCTQSVLRISGTPDGILRLSQVPPGFRPSRPSLYPHTLGVGDREKEEMEVLPTPFPVERRLGIDPCKRVRETPSLSHTLLPFPPLFSIDRETHPPTRTAGKALRRSRTRFFNGRKRAWFPWGRGIRSGELTAAKKKARPLKKGPGGQLSLV